MSKLKVLIWLDDYRNPFKDPTWLAKFAPEYKEDSGNVVIWLKDYRSFTTWISKFGLPDMIAFDHDLSDFQAMKAGYPEMMEDIPTPLTENTGMDACEWVVDYCIDNSVKFPKWVVQSSNPVGAKNISSLIINFIKHSEKAKIAPPF